MSQGKTAARGYGSKHRRKRTVEWAPLVEAGQVVCWDCGRPIVAGYVRTSTGRWVTNWHLGHMPGDRSLPPLPQHAWCNLSMAGREAARRQRAREGRRRPRVVVNEVRGPLSS